MPWINIYAVDFCLYKACIYVVELVSDVVRAKWGSWGIVVLTEVLYLTSNDLHRANKRVATEAQAGHFALEGILLVGEREGDGSGLVSRSKGHAGN